ncbi:hypothetical protein BDZ90DRAFT_263305 [Jaminaea rosea]|uniref:Uncharacterized protein n=1 Tax=Jaminaea rosea TaxID=1569628 RepID=A0A316UKH0_9BASI|nr:hypothetical protein BDZ90DRAFT_263305 [Jaminaea rosea]PWN24463.1 hypothetical protein BDZ90DRAFT_263305 [Jaminaea rosea]
MHAIRHFIAYWPRLLLLALLVLQTLLSTPRLGSTGLGMVQALGSCCQTQEGTYFSRVGGCPKGTDYAEACHCKHSCKKPPLARAVSEGRGLAVVVEKDK